VQRACNARVRPSEEFITRVRRAIYVKIHRSCASSGAAKLQEFGYSIIPFCVYYRVPFIPTGCQSEFRQRPRVIEHFSTKYGKRNERETKRERE